MLKVPCSCGITNNWSIKKKLVIYGVFLVILALMGLAFLGLRTSEVIYEIAPAIDKRNMTGVICGLIGEQKNVNIDYDEAFDTVVDMMEDTTDWLLLYNSIYTIVVFISFISIIFLEKCCTGCCCCCKDTPCCINCRFCYYNCVSKIIDHFEEDYRNMKEVELKYEKE